ncbi:hypothetical protein SELMODRAFT_10568, partial [Selaginella moellendorffii]
SSLLWACINSRALAQGKRVHQLAQQKGGETEKALSIQLVQMYLKCGSLADAREVIDRVRIGDVVTWTRLLAAYARNGDCERAIQAYQEMLQAGVTPNKITIVTLLNACVEHSCLPNTAQIRSNVFEMGFLSDAVVATVLVSMHSRFGRMEDACDAFREIQRHDVVSWNAMLWVYAENDFREEAMLLFREMQLEGSLPSKVSFLAVFNAVAAAEDSLEARAMHGLFLRSGIEQDLALGNAIVDMYGKCGCLDGALDVFRSMPERDIISWTAMIAAFVQCGAMLGALDSFRLMQLQGIRPNKVTFLTASLIIVVDSLGSLRALQEGRRIHERIMEEELDRDYVILGNALINMYLRCGDVASAWECFRRMPARDESSWNVMLAACSDDLRLVVTMVGEMQQQGLSPGKITLLALINSCVTAASTLPEARRVHARVVEAGLEREKSIANALVDMYSKCGNLEAASSVFFSSRLFELDDAVAWNALVLGHTQHGSWNEALGLFWAMQQQGVSPTEVSLVGVLASLSHAGMIQEGCRVFGSMEVDYGIGAAAEHRGCVVDLLSKVGWLEEAEEFMRSGCGSREDCVGWLTLLGACNLHGDVERGLRAAFRLLELDSINSAAHVILSNLFA